MISDDEGEDEATVELELERRLASPRGDMEYDDWDDEDPVDAMARTKWADEGSELYVDEAPVGQAVHGASLGVVCTDNITEESLQSCFRSCLFPRSASGRLATRR